MPAARPFRFGLMAARANSKDEWHARARKAEDLGDRVVNVFVKCEADPTSRLRGKRQVMLNDSDVHHHRQIKGAVGGVVGAATGDPAVFVSVGALHQGPSGGGTVAAIVDLG